MKITNIKVIEKKAKLKQPITISLGTIDYSLSAIVMIETDGYMRNIHH